MSHFVKSLSAGLLGTILIGSAGAQTSTVNVLAPIAVAQIGVPGSVNDDNLGNSPYYPQNPWFRSPSVREELRLNDQQHTALNREYERAWVQYNKNRNVIDSSLSTQRRAVREAELRSDFQKQFDPVVDTTFVEPAVRTRYNQLNYQYQGYRAFLDPSVQKELNLTADQQAQLYRYALAWDKEMANWRTDYPANRERVAQELSDARREALRRIDNTLTPAQRAKWNTLVGNHYEFEPEVYFPAPPAPTTTLKPAVP